MNGFRGCLTYLTQGRQGKNPERVEWCSTRNLGGLDGQKDHREIGRNMRATANLSDRTKKPVMHIPISWSKEDGPKLDRETMEGVADKVLKELGLENHQAAIYAHNDTGLKHIHIIVNRVDPETGKAWSTSRDWQRINNVLAKEERALGLEQVDHWGVEMDRDLERVKERLRVDDLNDIGPRPTDGELRQAEKENRIPDKPFAKEQIKELRDTIGADFTDATSWQELEELLGAKGYTLIPKGQGAVITDGNQVAKLSQMGRGVRLKGIEETFGKSYREWTQERASQIVDAHEKELNDGHPEKPNLEGLAPSEQRVAERIWKGEMEAARKRAERGARTGDPVKDLDISDMEARYWIQVAGTFRQADKAHTNARRRLNYHEGREGTSVDWLEKREAEFLGTFSKAYRDPQNASGLWDGLISKHGMAKAGEMVRKNPLLLGRLHGRRIINSKKVRSVFKRTGRERFKFGEFKDVRFFNNSKTRTVALREARKLTRQYDRYRKSQDILFEVRAKIEKAKRDVDRTKGEFEMLQNRGLTPKGLEQTLKSLFIRRAKTLDRVTVKALRQSALSKERKEQLERTRNQYEERKRQRKKERVRDKGLSMDFD